MAVFGRSSGSWENWSPYGWIVTGSTFRKMNIISKEKKDINNKNLVEKKLLQYFLNQWVYVYDHLIDDDHHFSNEKLK